MSIPKPIPNPTELKEGDVFLINVDQAGDLKGKTWDSIMGTDRSPNEIVPIKATRSYKPGTYVFIYRGDKEVTDIETRDYFNLDGMTPLKFFQLFHLFRLADWYSHINDLQSNVGYIKEAGLMGLGIAYDPAKKRPGTSGIRITQNLPDSEYFASAQFDITDQTPSPLEVRLEGLTMNKMMRLARMDTGRKIAGMSTYTFGDLIAEAGTKLLENGVYVQVPTEIANGSFGADADYVNREFGGTLVKPSVIPRYGVEQKVDRMDTLKQAKLWVDRVVVALNGK